MGNTNQNEKVNIVIDLAECMNARSFDSDKIIHKAEFERCVELINSKIEKIDRNQNSVNDTFIRTRYNDTITILGSRGSGKTSFLMSVLNEFKDNSKIEILDIIDPTLIEEKGHIFLTLISLINSKVEEAISKAECNPCSKEHHNRSCWDKFVKKMAAGLPYIGIDNNSLYSNWHDPEHIMKKGLECVKAAKELEENFEKVVKYALDILGKKAFLIAFDDIDVNFEKGWQVLETIRKYLTSPHIITLLSGDIKLFSKAIRKNQWNNFGNNLLTYEGEKLKRIDQFDDMVTELESQYLQKIMKTPNRIHLLTIGELINNNQVNLAINNQENEIYKHYITLLKDWGVKNKYEARSILSYLLTLPLRTQIQFLKQYEDSKNDTKKLNLMNITDTFISDMYELGIDVEQAKSQHKDLCYIAHNFLIKQEMLNETYQLLPTSGGAKYNATLFSLNTMFVEHSRNNPYMFFEYWITIATIKNLLTIMPYRSELKKDASLLPTVEGLSDYSFIGQNKVFRDICSYLSTYIRATLNNKGNDTRSPWGGTLILKGLAQKAQKDYKDRIDSIFKEEESLMKRQLAFFPMSIASFPNKQQSLVVYSFYTLLGTIIELLKRINLNNVSDDANVVNEISVLLSELAQVKDDVMPVFDKTTGIIDDDILYNNIEENVDNQNNELAEILHLWMKKSPTCVPPHLIGKAATRAFYAMRGLDDKKLDDDNHNLGDAMHKRIIIALNSVLIEDAKENLEVFDFSNNNPTDKNNIFIKNLKKLNNKIIKNTKQEDAKNLNNNEIKEEKNIDYKSCLEFSRWFMSCPLLLLYLNPRIDESVQNVKETPSEKTELIEESGRSLLETKDELEVDIQSMMPPVQELNSDTENKTIYNELEWCIDIYNGLSFMKKTPSQWFAENSIYDKLKDVSIYVKKRKDVVKKTLYSFALSNKKNATIVIDILKTKYSNPHIFIETDIDEILIHLKDSFKSSNQLKNNITKLCNKCEGCDTWDDVKKKF